MKLVGATPLATVHDILTVVADVESRETRRTSSVGSQFIIVHPNFKKMTTCSAAILYIPT